MDLFKEILARALTYGEVRITFPGQEIDVSRIVEGECYKALQQIRAVLADSNLDDRECFMKIEQIVCIFEEVGCSGGGRHDFG